MLLDVRASDLLSHMHPIIEVCQTLFLPVMVLWL